MGENEVFRVPCSLVKNGISVNLLALPDPGAHGFCFLDRRISVKICKLLNIAPFCLPQPITPKGYDGVAGRIITHFIVANMQIDNHTLSQVPFLILDLGNQDAILGDGWMAHFDVLPDLRNKCLFWRSSPENIVSFSRQLQIPRSALQQSTPCHHHQKDVSRRDTLFDLEGKRRSDGRNFAHMAALRLNTCKKVSFEIEESEPALQISLNVQKLQGHPQNELKDIKGLLLKHKKDLNKELVGSKSSQKILKISPVTFHLLSRKEETQAQEILLHDLDRELEDRYSQSRAEETHDHASKLPKGYQELLDVFSKLESDTLPPHREYDHKTGIEGKEQLSYGPLYKQSTKELQAVKQYLVENLHKGWIEPSKAPYSSPLLFVKKPDGNLRLCVDYRKLNNITRKDRYPLPLIDETLARLNQAKIFTKLDIRQAFHRIRMHPDSEELTTFRTRYESYKYKVLPLGLTNGPATYQRYMNDVLFEYLDVFCTVYLDDILIYSDNESDNELHVRMILVRLRKAGLQADLRECEFGVKETKYLGFIISTQGIRVDPEKIEVIKSWVPPTTVKGVQSFLGFCNFYPRFIRDYGIISKPLTRLTHKDREFIFTDECHGSFKELKNRLINAPVLAHYDPSFEFRIETDASDGVVAGVFSQLGKDGNWYPVAFFSKTMAPAELDYEIHDKEMLAIVRSFGHWRAELQGTSKKIEIFTDHKALEYFMTTKALNARQARWAELLSEFNFLIKYRAGKANVIADALSRREEDVKKLNSEKKKLRNQVLLKPNHTSDSGHEPKLEICLTETFELVDRLLLANKNDQSLVHEREQETSSSEGPYKLEEGLLLYKGRLMVPDVDNICTNLITEAHTQPSTAHPGLKKTLQLVGARYYWKGMKEFIKRYIDNCHDCRKSHLSHEKQPGWLHSLPIP